MHTPIACTTRSYRIIPPTADIIAAVHDDDENCKSSEFDVYGSMLL